MTDTAKPIRRRLMLIAYCRSCGLPIRRRMRRSWRHEGTGSVWCEQ